MPNESASFALDAVRKQSSRLDSIQDHLSGSLQTPPTEGEDDDAHRQEIVRVESNFNSQIAQSKTLLDPKQLESALKTLDSSRISNESSILLLPRDSGRADIIVDQVALFELISAARLTYSVYGLVLNDLLEQAESLNDQAWYWTEVEEDPVQTFTYLIQTLPERIINLAIVIAKKLGDTTLAPLASASSQNSTLSPQERHRRAELSFNTDTLRRSWKIIRESPVLAIGALFPLSVNEEAGKKAPSDTYDSFNDRKKTRNPQLASAARILTPLGLTRHEAHSKRAKLIKRRDEMAIKVGTLSQALSELDTQDTKDTSVNELQSELWQRIEEMQSALAVQSSTSSHSNNDLNSALHQLVNDQIFQQRKHIDLLLSSAPLGLGLPSRLARLWPALVLGPVLSIVGIRLVTRSWDTIVEKAQNAKETVRGFVINWVYDPCVKLLDTIRTGDQEGGMIISPESLNSDLQSLERMVSDFSAEKYGITGPELEEVAARVREGDLTTVLRIYEAELKSPLKSAISGSLIRSLLIQIQKVKVDIAVAMRGVDQLLKSQQLLFGAIGIAPAMGIIYVVGGFFKSRLSIALGGQGKRVGQSVRYRAWEAMRRIDRLLADTDLTSGPLPPLTQGLLLLDLTLLRKLAPQLVAQAAGAGSGNRATRSKRLRAEFLNDIRDLENFNHKATSQQRKEGQPTSALDSTAMSGLGWHARRAAVDRMWKSWGHFMSLSTSS